MKVTQASRIAYYLLIVIISANFSLSYSRFTQIIPIQSFVMENYLQYDGTLPFQFRILPVVLFSIFKEVVHLFFHNDLRVGNSSHGLNDLFFLILNFFSMALSIIFMRRTIEFVRPGTPWSWCAFALPYMAYFTYIISNGSNYFYPYDITSLMFTTILLYATVSGRTLLFAVVLLISTFNKETSVFSILLYVMWNIQSGALDKKNVALFLAIWLGVKGILYFLFRDLHPLASSNQMGPGNLYEIQFIHNIKSIDVSTIISLPMIFGMLWVLLIICRKYLVEKWQKYFLAAIALWIIVIFFVGNLTELRVFGEVIPALTLLLTTVALPALRNQLEKV